LTFVKKAQKRTEALVKDVANKDLVENILKI
jgi:hypothetical protein